MSQDVNLFWSTFIINLVHALSFFWRNSCHLLVLCHQQTVSSLFVLILMSTLSMLFSELDSCNLKQLVTKPTHPHGYTPDSILAPEDGSYSYNMKVCDLLSHNALVKCHKHFPYGKPLINESVSSQFLLYWHVSLQIYFKWCSVCKITRKICIWTLSVSMISVSISLSDTVGNVLSPSNPPLFIADKV